MVHGWNKTYFDGDWHLTDITWDDPSVGSQDSNDTDPAPGREYYEYFIIDDDKGHTAGDQAADTGRGGAAPSYIGNALTGWY